MEDSVKEFFKIGDFEKQIELERELLFVTEDRARVLRQFGLDFAERNPEIIAGLEEQVKATREIAQVGSVVQKSFEDGFIAIVEGSKSVVGAFKNMARLIIKEAVQGSCRSKGSRFFCIGRSGRLWHTRFSR